MGLPRLRKLEKNSASCDTLHSMKWWFGGAVAVLLLIGVGAFVYVTKFQPRVVSPLGKFIEKPLDKYTIVNLSKRAYIGSQIILDDAAATTSGHTVYSFHFTSDDKKVTGIAHIPKGKGPFPVIVQFRGFVERDKYFPGEGTAHSSEVYADNGFLTLAPDFLGYGGSASGSADVFEDRFETYTTALNLLASVKTLPIADATKIAMWGHSNGGQIALTVSEILSKPIPMVLWAPVSKPFPYSILYYTDDIDDHGKALRKVLARFEENYDAELYSLTNYLDRIAAPMQVHQGTADASVPVAWSDALVKTLKEKEKNVTYFTYPEADHNLMPGWNTVVSRDIEFFRKNLK